jgi:hypothetical protein
MQRQDIRMIQPGRDLDLSQKTFDTERSREFRAEHLECDGAIVLQIRGQVDDGHAAMAELALDRVALRKCRLQPLEEAGHRVACSHWRRT